MVKYEKIINSDIPIKLVRFTGEIYPYIDKHWHNSIEIVLAVCGGSTAFIDGKYYPLYQNDTGIPVIINSCAIHSFGTPNTSGPYIGLALQINYDFFKSIYKDIDHIQFKQPDCHNCNPIKECLYRLVECFELRNKNKRIEIIGQVYHLIYLLVSELGEKKKDSVIQKSNKNKHRLTSIVKYIDAHYQDKLTIEVIIEHFNLSEGHLSKIFKDNMDITVKAYISQIRVSHARDMLIDTDLPLIDIALASGFPNTKALNKEFKHLYDISPLEYRRNINMYDH